MKRTITNDLRKWKDKENRKPLLLTGVRQCGKTYILKKFAQESFEDFAYLNLEQTPLIADVFTEDFNCQRIIDDLSNLFIGKPIIQGKTLLILDEIQVAARAITSLKYFQEDMPELAIIGAGSLLGVSIGQETVSFPVGKVDRLAMYPMSFVEFLAAGGKENFLQALASHPLDEPLADYIYAPLEKMYQQYLIVGGMPEVVKAWWKTQDLAQVAEIQDHILYGFENDFAKYAPSRERLNIETIWQSIPQQLAKDNNKFIFGHVKKSARAKDLEASLHWLKDAGLIHILKKVEQAQIPLSAFADASYYKVFMSDTGLLSRRANFAYASLLDSKEQSGNFRGSLTENYVLNELINQNRKPYFWRSGNTAELDFIIEDKGRVIPIEAKANLNTQAKSYRIFAQRYQTEIGFKFSLKNIGVNYVSETKTYSLPLFSLHRLEEYLRAPGIS